VKLTKTERNNVVVVEVEGELAFATAMDFRAAIVETISSSPAMGIEIDLRSTSYLDSSGLGVLLTAREVARKIHKEVVLTHCQGEVRNILHVARFDRLFSIT
jgi:anti-anti-sigma factor